MSLVLRQLQERPLPRCKGMAPSSLGDRPTLWPTAVAFRRNSRRFSGGKKVPDGWEVTVKFSLGFINHLRKQIGQPSAGITNEWKLVCYILSLKYGTPTWQHIPRGHTLQIIHVKQLQLVNTPDLWITCEIRISNCLDGSRWIWDDLKNGLSYNPMIYQHFLHCMAILGYSHNCCTKTRTHTHIHLFTA